MVECVYISCLLLSSRATGVHLGQEIVNKNEVYCFKAWTHIWFLMPSLLIPSNILKFRMTLRATHWRWCVFWMTLLSISLPWPLPQPIDSYVSKYKLLWQITEILGNTCSISHSSLTVWNWDTTASKNCPMLFSGKILGKADQGYMWTAVYFYSWERGSMK